MTTHGLEGLVMTEVTYSDLVRHEIWTRFPEYEAGGRLPNEVLAGLSRAERRTLEGLDQLSDFALGAVSCSCPGPDPGGGDISGGATRRAYIGSVSARKVLWYFAEDVPAFAVGKFDRHLLAALSVADHRNFPRLGSLFPSIGGAVVLVRVDGGLEALREIAAGGPRATVKATGILEPAEDATADLGWKHASHALWFDHEGGVEPGSFVRSLLGMIRSADDEELGLLERMWPLTVRASRAAGDVLRNVASPPPDSSEGDR